MNFLILFIKGLIIGIGKIIPGISGSVLAISLNVYNIAIYKIQNIFKNFKDSLIYLFPLGLGIIVTISLFSRVILYFIINNYSVSLSLITGLIIGTIPNYIKGIKIKYNSVFLLGFLFVLFSLLFRIKLNLNMNNYIVYFVLGLTEAFTSIIPGISSTSIYMNLNIYNNFLTVFKNPLSIKFIIFSIGTLIGVFYTSKLINYFIKNYKYETDIVIVSLVLSSMIGIIQMITFNFLNICLLIIGFVISYVCDK